MLFIACYALRRYVIGEKLHIQYVKVIVFTNDVCSDKITWH